jgi:hypothetical protein
MKRKAPLSLEIFTETIDLVHPFMQDRHDADVAIRQPSPIDKMPFVPKIIPLDGELGRDGFRHHPWRSI